MGPEELSVNDWDMQHLRAVMDDLKVKIDDLRSEKFTPGRYINVPANAKHCYRAYKEPGGYNTSLGDPYQLVSSMNVEVIWKTSFEEGGIYREYVLFEDEDELLLAVRLDDDLMLAQKEK